MSDMQTTIRQAFSEGRFLDIIEVAPLISQPRERLMLAIAYEKMGRESEAVAIFDELADLLDELVRALYHRARIHREHGQEAAARACIERYLAFFPDDDEAADFLEMGDEGEAFVQAPSLELARLYANQGHFEQSLEIFVELLPQDRSLVNEALKVQQMLVIQTLESWRERLQA